MLHLATEILFVDQHYSGSAAHGRPLKAMLAEAFKGKRPQKIEYHLNADGTAEWFRSRLDAQRRYLRFPEGGRICFVRWLRLDGGENLHPRYILTNRGGLGFDYGLDEGVEGETTDWRLLSEPLLQHRRAQFRPGAGCFGFVDAWVVTTSEVREASLGDGWSA